MSFPSVEEQLVVIRRGIEQICPEEELAGKLKQSLETGEPLRIKYGIDPTGIDVHLGHTVPLRKMRQFQELGHQAVIIIGNYTALVGDPSGRDEARTGRLSLEQVERNAQDYLEQVGKVVDLETAEVHRNGDWFAELQFADVLNLCNRVTVAQMLNRDDFSRRYSEEKAIYLHECLYPVMQAQDSVEIKADIELGGTEQLFTFMLARDFQRDAGQSQQIGVMSPILVGLDGKRRMGKSLDNYIGISESPFDMMKKFMQIPDNVMRMYFELLTTIPMDEIDTLLSGHPKTAKMKLAGLVIAEYHTAAAAEDSAERWQKEIGSSGALPADIPERCLHLSQLDGDGCVQAAILIKELELVPSTSEAQRRIKGNAVFVIRDGVKERVTDRSEPIRVETGLIVRAGKKDWAAVKVHSMEQE
ncbi:MAG: tyrosine--tRNA ligase [Planctomycetaceae bacterium]